MIMLPMWRWILQWQRLNLSPCHSLTWMWNFLWLLARSLYQYYVHVLTCQHLWKTGVARFFVIRWFYPLFKLILNVFTCGLKLFFLIVFLAVFELTLLDTITNEALLQTWSPFDTDIPFYERKTLAFTKQMYADEKYAHTKTLNMWLKIFTDIGLLFEIS